MTSSIRLSLLTEQQLIEGCISGKANFQEMFYRKYCSVMFGLCLRYASDYHQAEDNLQEGFIKVFNNLHKFARKGSFEGWMKRIFINTSIEAFRKKQNWLELLPNDQSTLYTTETGILDHLATQDLMRCIQQLPDGYRTVFNLYIIEGYAHQEISEMLNITVGTSKSQLSRARTALQAIIKQLEKQNEKQPA